jgi:tetratricopeptide (TPR) repeat protein
MSLFNDGKFEILWNWMNVLESETEIKNPHIAFYLGAIYKFYIGDLERALSYLEKSIEMLAKDKDPNAFVKFYILKAGVMLNLGKIKQVIQELEGLLHMQTSDDNKAQILYYLAYAYYQNAEYDKTEKLLNNAFDLSENGSELATERYI